MEINIIFDTVCPWCYIGKRLKINAAAAMAFGGQKERFYR